MKLPANGRHYRVAAGVTLAPLQSAPCTFTCNIPTPVRRHRASCA